jgi:L-threonylcarbamoyladenylate synthase
VDFLTPDGQGIEQAVRLLRQGEVIGFPTDTVYGLAAVASDERAVRRIFELKGRSLSQPLVLMVASAAGLEAWAEVDDRAQRYMQTWWPGPLTLVLPARPGVGPPLAIARLPRTIATRIPDHAIALLLLRESGEALATTSANRSGEPPALTPLEAARVGGLGGVVDAGRAPGGVPSTLLDLSGGEPRVLRRGPIEESELLTTPR